MGDVYWKRLTPLIDGVAQVLEIDARIKEPLDKLLKLIGRRVRCVCGDMPDERDRVEYVCRVVAARVSHFDESLLHKLVAAMKTGE